MSDFEDRIRKDLRLEPAAADEAFVSLVAGRVEASSRRRTIGLALASLLAVALIGAMASGLAMMGPVLAAQMPGDAIALPDQTLSLLSLAVPMFGMAVLALLLAPLAQAQR